MEDEIDIDEAAHKRHIRGEKEQKVAIEEEKA